MIGPKKTSLIQWLPRLALALSLTSSTACAKDVPVLAPSPPPCPLPHLEDFPTLTTVGCGDQVCVPADQAAQLWLWIRDVQRWVTQASVCLDNRAALPATQPAPAKDTWSPVFDRQLEVITVMAAEHPDVTVDVLWAPCGGVNGYYVPDRKVIVLCTENAAYPELALFVAAHEMGHAIGIQLLHVDDEESADELGALAMIDQGLERELLEAGIWFLNQGDRGPSSAGHPSNYFRAWNLACMAVGSDDPRHKCRALYQGTKMRWDRRLP